MIWTTGEVQELPIEPTSLRFPLVQSLADGGLLIVESRVVADAPPNASVYDRAGSVVRRIMFGDGIQDVQLDRDGRAWVGYFDEGVFGNYGWGGVGGGPEPIGWSGLNRFDLATGQLDWSFSPPAGSDPIADCYAMNVASTGTWIYYYTGFDLMAIRADGTIDRWRTRTFGANAIAVDANHVLLVGDYKRPHSATLWQLGDEVLTQPNRVNLLHTDGRGAPGPFLGRGDAVYVVEGPRVLRASLGDLGHGEGLEDSAPEHSDVPAWVDHIATRHG